LQKEFGWARIGKQINTNEAIAQSMQDYTFWNDYNIELIKRAFNRPDNQYFKEYTYTASSLATTIVPFRLGPKPQPTIADRANKIRHQLETKLHRLSLIHKKLPLIDVDPRVDKQIGQKEGDLQDNALINLSIIFSKFHKVAQSLRRRHANRETLLIRDEYDVQDLLQSMLQLYFDDVRAEDYSPSYAGANSRTDFVLKNEQIIIEVKMSNEHLSDKEIGSQLLIDIGRYRGHPDCKVLVVFIYDKGDFIRNKPGLISDLNRMSGNGLQVKVFIYPN
jgi:hypothetical protein